jgi:large subunit ribosomal protein L29
MAKRQDLLNSIRNIETEALVARIKDDEVRLRKLTFAHSVTPLENPMSIRELRRDISRLKTELAKRSAATA